MEATLASPEKWRRLKLAVIGGDEREQEIARLAAATGASVRAYGFPMPEDGIDGVTLCDNAPSAFQDVDIALFPIPLNATDGSLFAEVKIIPDASLLTRMADGAQIVLGKADRQLEQAAARCGIGLHEYESDQELMLLRAPAIVEGALQRAIDITDITIHNARVCVVGQGNIGTALTRTLIALGARVTVAARNPVQRAAAYALGARSIHTDELEQEAPNFDMLFSTVPVALVTSAVIDRLPGQAMVMDLSAPPGGCDLDYASTTGRAALWARALGRRAPITVGQSQWVGIVKLINAILDGRTA